MITSFKVGAIFQIQDQAGPVVQRLSVMMRDLAASTATVRTELQAISAVRIGSVTNRVTALAASLDKGATAAAAMSASIVGGAAQMDASLGAALATARALTAQLTAAGRAGALAGRGGGVPALPGPGGGGGRHGPRGPHLGRVGVGMGPAHVSAGGGSAVATGVGVWGVAHVMKEAMDPLHQEAMLRMLGLDDSQIGQVTSRARATASAVPGSGYAGNVKAIGEMYSVVGLSGALQLSEKMAQVDRAMALSGKGSAEGSSYILTRAGELMGRLTDPTTHQVDLAGFGNILDTMAKVTVATHGKVTPAEWLNYAKQAGPASGSLDENGMLTTATIIQAMGGHRAGTAAAALQRQFAGGIMSQRVAGELQSLGLAGADDFEVRRGGQVVAKSGAMQGLVSKLQHDPLTAIVDTIAPALESHGFDTPEKQAREIYKIAGTGPGQREIYELLRGREQIRQERERAKGGLAPGAALISATAHDPVQGMAAFTKSFNDMLGAIGSPTLTSSLPAMHALTTLFNSVAAAAANHKTAAGVLGSIGAGAAGGAGIGFLTGWLGGPVGAGGGALIGGGVGAGIATWNALPTSMTEGAKTGASWGNRIAGPWGGIAGGTMGGLWGALPAILPSGTAGAAPASGGGQMIKIDVGGLTVKAETDDPRGLAEKILAEINRLITMGHTHNLGEADTSASSPYNTGAAMP